MKVFVAPLTEESVTGYSKGEHCAPWTVAAGQRATRDALGARGLLADRLESADLVLVDVVDHLAAHGRDSFTDLSQLVGSTGARVVVRLHGAWRMSAPDPDPWAAAQADLAHIWELADHVLVATRSHLVRLASSGGIVAPKARLAPLAILGVEGQGGDPEVPQERTQILVAGEPHRAALAPVLDMLAEADPAKAVYQVVAGEAPFRAGLRAARALLVPAAGTFGDRSLVDAALRAGVAVVGGDGGGGAGHPAAPGTPVGVPLQVPRGLASGPGGGPPRPAGVFSRA